MAEDALASVQGGFKFDMVQRNLLLEQSGLSMPKTKKTGTTIAGVMFKNGVVLGADTRATEGPIVCDKNCEKIHYIAPNIYCCGAGTSADTENSTGLISSKLTLHRQATGRVSRVSTAMTLLKRMLFKYQGHVSAALVLGGVDASGPSLYTIYPHGSTDKLPYVTMGSGSLAAMAVFEAGYKDNMSRDEAVALVEQAILSGIWNDLGSGGNVDICVLWEETSEDGKKKEYKKEMLRNYKTPNARPFRRDVTYPRGTTAVLSQHIEKHTTGTVASTVAAGASTTTTTTTSTMEVS